jgi:hypothetical protein
MTDTNNTNAAAGMNVTFLQRLIAFKIWGLEF